ADGRLHNDRLNNIREDVAGNNVEISSAERSRRFDKFAFAHGQHLGADQTSVADPTSERQRQDKIKNTGAAEGHKGDRDENSGEGKKGIHQHDVDEAVDAAAVVSGEAANDEAEQKRTRHHAAADEQRNSRAPDQAGEYVASEFIGAAPMLRRRRLQAIRQIDV